MIFCLPALASLSGKQPYSATFGLRGWHVPLTPKAKRYFLRVTSLAVTPTKKYYCAVRSKSNHLTNHTDCLCVNSLRKVRTSS